MAKGTMSRLSLCLVSLGLQPMQANVQGGHAGSHRDDVHDLY